MTDLRVCVRSLSHEDHAALTSSHFRWFKGLLMVHKNKLEKKDLRCMEGKWAVACIIAKGVFSPRLLLNFGA